MLLTLDIGNTNITAGLFRDRRLAAHWRLASDGRRTTDEYGLQMVGLLEHHGHRVAQLDGICMASVVPNLTSRMGEVCRRFLDSEPLVVSAGVKTGVRILSEDPRTVGADRVVNVCAVKALYGGPACVVDFGTATTFDAVSEDGAYLGGAIAPGIQMGAEGLTRATAALPRVDFAEPPCVIGRNTVHAIQSGLVYGYASMVEGMVARFREQLGANTTVIATGGLAEEVARVSNVLDAVEPWLTLEGLRLIWSMNR